MGNLNITQVSASQNNKETTINDQNNELDLALSEVSAILVDNTNARTLTAAEWTRAQQFAIQNDSPVPTDVITLTTPATTKGIFSVFNQTSFTVTVVASGQTAAGVVVSPGAIRMMSHNGTNVRPAAGESLSQGVTFIGGFIPPTFRGARVRKAADLTGQDFTAGPVIITWDTELYDTDGIHDNVTNTERLTVPTGVTKVRLTAAIRLINASVDGDFFCAIRNDAGGIIALTEARMSEDFSNEGMQVTIGVIDVTGGDWFDTVLQLSGDTSVDVESSSSFFTMEIIESANNADFTSQIVTINGRFNGATAQNSADLTTQDFSAGDVVTWDTDTIDTNGFHDTVSDTERLTIPSGVTKVRLGANVRLELLTAGEDWSVRIRKNAADFPGGAHAAGMTVDTTVEASISTPVVDVVAGDFFDVFVDTEADASVTVDALASAFWIEVVEVSGASDVPPAFIAVSPQFFGVLAKTNTAQSLTNATDNPVEFDSVIYDTKFKPDDLGVSQRMWLGVDFTFVDGDVSVGNDTVTETGHGFTTGEGPIRLSNSGGALPTGLATGTDYWIIVDDVDTFRFALSRADALADTDVDITAAAGGGTHTAETETWVVVPAGVTKVRFTGHAATAGSTGDIVLSLFKNGAIVDGGFQTDMDGTDADKFTATSATLEVSEGDRFELIVNPAAGTVTLDAASLDTFLAMEVVETSKPLSFPGIPISLPSRGALVSKVADETGANYSAGVLVPWDEEIYDTDGFHDNATDNTRLTIPAGSGITKVKFAVTMTVTNLASSNAIRLLIAKNGSIVSSEGLPGVIKEVSTTLTMNMNASSAIIDVVEGDFFEVWLDTESDTNIDVNHQSWFSIEAVETNESAAAPDPIEVYLDTAAWDTAAFPTSNPVYKKIAVRRFSLHDNFSGSQGQADAGPNGGAVVIDVQRNGSSIGSINFADSTGAAQTATFSTTGSVQEDFEIGDRLELVAPANWQSMDEVVIALWAFRS